MPEEDFTDSLEVSKAILLYLVCEHLYLARIVVHVHDLSCQGFSQKQLKQNDPQGEYVCLCRAGKIEVKILRAAKGSANSKPS